MGKSLFKQNVIRGIVKSAQYFKILSLDFGQFKSMQNKECIDRYSPPIPCYTYSAIEYINQLNLKDKIIIEYGSGSSTIYWASRCKKLISIEDDLDWYERIRK